MSFIYSQALVAESWPDKCLDTDASVPSNGNPTPRPCLWHDKTMEASRLSRFGMTCRLLTADRGAELLTSWLAGFPAKTSALQEKAQESTVPGRACGDTWRGSLARFDLDLSSWRTAQPSLLGDLEESSVTWPRSGMTAGGLCWELPMLERPTKEIDSGFWPTPTTQDNVQIRGVGKAADHPRRGTTLGGAVRMWPTPTTRDRGSDAPNRTGGPSLAVAVRKWPTPTAHNAKETNAPSEALRNEPTLASLVGGHLNPFWIEWLMGWPIGHTDLKQSATDKFPNAPRQPSDTYPQPLSEQAA